MGAARSGQQIRPEAQLAKETGYAVSHDEVIPGVSAVAVPVSVPGQLPAAIAVVYIRTDTPDREIAVALKRSAATIEAELH